MLNLQKLMGDPAVYLPVSFGDPTIRSGLMGRGRFLVSLMILVLICSCALAFANSVPTPLKLNNETNEFNLKGHVGLYEDKTGEETLDVVRQKTFRAVPEAMPSLGFTRSAYWIKLMLDNGPSRLSTIVLELVNHYLDFVDIFVISNRTSHMEKYHGGARVPLEGKVSQDRNPIVRLDFAPDEQKTIFVRVQSRTPLRLPLVLLSEAAYQRKELSEYLFNGLFFGALVFLIIYSLFAWSILRQNAYLYYILLILGVGALHLAYTGLFPRLTVFSRPPTILHYLTAGIGFTFIFNIIFVSSFMNSRAKYPILHRTLDIFLIFAVINTVLYFYNYYWGNTFAMIYGPILACVLVVVIGAMWYWGESRARYLCIAHIPLPVLGIVYVGVQSGLIPFSFVLAQSLKFAYLFQGMFFALALADRYALMQRHFQNMLEDQVAERSADLVTANVNLHREMIERVRVEKAIEKAKHEWEQTFDTIPDLIAIIDENHTIVRINRAMAHKMNLHPRDAIGMNCYQVCHGLHEPAKTCPLRRSVFDAKEHSGEVTESMFGGTYLVSVTPLPRENHQPRTFVHVARDITERKIFEERLRELAITDSLTNVWNRRHFMHLAGRELNRTKRYGGKLAIIMMDLDHFKTVNDAYGHDVGDQALKKVAEIARTTLRKVDIFARYGGEEFVIALPETSLEQAVQVAERLGQIIGQIPLSTQDGPLHIHVSIGVTVAGPDSPDLMTLLKQADKALYQAKNSGRNRVEVFVPPSPQPQ